MPDDTATATDSPQSNPTETDDRTAVPAGETPATCDYCGRPFPDDESLTLHRGLEHYESLTADEQERFIQAYRAEEPDLRRFRIVALGLLVLIYFGFLLLYAGVT
jgi:hypothetical protein